MPPSDITMEVVFSRTNQERLSATFCRDEFLPSKLSLRRSTSSSSTASTSSVTTTASSSSINSEETTTRRVKFSTIKTELLTSIPPASHMTSEEKSCLWWGKDELDEIERLAETQCRTMIQCRPLLASSPSSTSYQAVLGRLYDACCSASNDQCVEDLVQSNIVDFQQLVHWTRTSHNRRGLEGQTFKLMNYHQSSKNGQQLRDIVIHAVLRLQSNENVRDTTMAESIMYCSQRMTRASRLFAQVLALADSESLKSKEKGNRRRSLDRPINPEKAKQRRSHAMALMV